MAICHKYIIRIDKLGWATSLVFSTRCRFAIAVTVFIINRSFNWQVLFFKGNPHLIKRAHRTWSLRMALGNLHPAMIANLANDILGVRWSSWGFTTANQPLNITLFIGLLLTVNEPLPAQLHGPQNPDPATQKNLFFSERAYVTQILKLSFFSLTPLNIPTGVGFGFWRISSRPVFQKIFFSPLLMRVYF